MKLQIRKGAWYCLADGTIHKAEDSSVAGLFILGDYTYNSDGTVRGTFWQYNVSHEVTVTPVVQPEPKRYVLWLNWYQHAGVSIHSSKASADRDVISPREGQGRIACQRLELVEGQFDTESNS